MGNIVSWPGHSDPSPSDISAAPRSVQHASSMTPQVRAQQTRDLDEALSPAHKRASGALPGPAAVKVWVRNHWMRWKLARADAALRAVDAARRRLDTRSRNLILRRATLAFRRNSRG